MSATLELAKSLINIPSITPNDMGCQDLLKARLQSLGFEITTLDRNGVHNFFALLGDRQKPLLVFSAHTDVVPPGNLKDWRFSPFESTVHDNKLYGRGAADMKSALAAMIVSIENFLQNHKASFSIGVMITSDEEGVGTDGTIAIVEYLAKNNLIPTWCLIGEATSSQQLGDTIKVGRRGSLHGTLTVHGKQGHIAYPALAINPIHRSFQALDHLTTIEWDSGNEYFTPTSFQIYNINADTGATNVIPGSLTAKFNFRFAPVSTADDLKSKTEAVFKKYGLHYEIEWNLSSHPFLSENGLLKETCEKVIEQLCGIKPVANTTGGTSDGRFIARLGCEIIELGLMNESIHQVDEHTDIGDLEKLTEIYGKILEEINSELLRD